MAEATERSPPGQGPSIRRLKGVEDVVPIAYGSIAWWLGKKPENEYYTHRWTVYLRGANNEDLSHIIKSVTFSLHPSFKNPVRVLEFPPYEVTESGWGEFDVGIAIEFTAAAAACLQARPAAAAAAPAAPGPQANAPAGPAKALEMVHGLKLYPEGEGAVPSLKKPVVAERYEEIVFSEPSEEFHQILTTHAPKQAPATEVATWAPHHSDREELWSILQARRIVDDHTALLKQQLTEMGGVF